MSKLEHIQEVVSGPYNMKGTDPYHNVRERSAQISFLYTGFGSAALCDFAQEKPFGIPEIMDILRADDQALKSRLSDVGIEPRVLMGPLGTSDVGAEGRKGVFYGIRYVFSVEELEAARAAMPEYFPGKTAVSKTLAQVTGALPLSSQSSMPPL